MYLLLDEVPYGTTHAFKQKSDTGFEFLGSQNLYRLNFSLLCQGVEPENILEH